MSQKEEIISLLNEEKWTRSVLHNYTVASFKNLDEILEGVIKSNSVTNIQEILEVCQEHLQHAKNSIIALYISGIMKLLLQNIDDSDLVQLIQIFSDNYKKNIVEHLAYRILDFCESKVALQSLAQIYDGDDQDDKLLSIWERLILVDHEEALVPLKLAEKLCELGDVDAAIRNYKKSLHRYIAKKDFSHVREVWQKLLDLAAKETDFLYHAASTVEVSLGIERAVQLLALLYPIIKDQSLWEEAIALLKRILSYDPQNNWARGEILACYRQLYEKKQNLEKYINISNLNQNVRNVHEAIASFEKHIAFDIGNFVYHKSWGVGRICKVNIDDITIDFAKRRNHHMSIEMAGNSLETLPKNHIKVLKNIWKRDVLYEKVKNNVVWTLKIIIQSYDNCADIKIIREELVPSILTTKEWTSWGTSARNALRSNPIFGVVTDKLGFFTVHKKPVDFAEKTYHRFELERTFFNRLTIVYFFLDTLKSKKNNTATSDYFQEMMVYFVGIANRNTNLEEQRVAATLLVEYVIENYSIHFPLKQSFKEIYDTTDMDDMLNCIVGIPNKNIRSLFIKRLSELDKDWLNILSKLFTLIISKEIVDILRNEEDGRMLAHLYETLLRDYRRYRLHFVWLVRYITTNDLYSDIVTDEELLFITLIHIYELTLRDLDAKTNISEQRKVQKYLIDYLFDSNRLKEFFLNADKKYVQRVYTLLQEIRHIDPKLLLDFRNAIQQRFPDFSFHDPQPTDTAQSIKSNFFVTEDAYLSKQRELNTIRDVELSKNSKEIEKARSFGDLRENAEYKAALERQQTLQNKLILLENELKQARVLHKSDVDHTATKVTFGTKVVLTQSDDSETIEYTVLGPWESEPDKGVISYQAPLGQALYNRSVGETVELKISGHSKQYLVENISLVAF